MCEPVHPFGGLEVHELLRHEIRDLAGDLDFELRGIPGLNAPDSGAPRGQSLPGRFDADPERGNRSYAGDDDALQRFYPFASFLRR